MEYVLQMCALFNIDVVPHLYTGPYCPTKMKELATGNTTLVEDNPHIREGIVIKPKEERFWGNRRCILKLINDDYLLRKGGTENH